MWFDRPVSFQKREIAATLGKVGRGVLRIVVLGLALVGFLHLTRGTAVRHVRGVTADGVPISVSEPEFPLMATMATGAWLAPGNRVELMLNGDQTYPRLWDDLRSAQRSITLQLYYGAPGRMADTLGQILRERAKAGVRVFVLYDAFGTVDIPRTTATSCARPESSWNRFARSASQRCISRRTGHTCAGSSSTVEWAGREGSGSMTSGLATAAAAVPGVKRTCASKARQFDNSKQPSLRHGSKRPG